MILPAARKNVKSAVVLFSALVPHKAPASFGAGVLPATVTPAAVPASAPDYRTWTTEVERQARWEETTFSKAERDFAVRHGMTLAEAREELALMELAEEREMEREFEASMMDATEWETHELGELRTTPATLIEALAAEAPARPRRGLTFGQRRQARARRLAASR